MKGDKKSDETEACYGRRPAAAEMIEDASESMQINTE